MGLVPRHAASRQLVQSGRAGVRDGAIYQRCRSVQHAEACGVS